MSWLDKVNTDLKIKCGDGKEYQPNYLNAKRAKEYNIAKFDFRDIPGTLVKRRAPKGRVYPIEIIFQGENHLDVATAFDESSDDPRPWTISHPYYGQLIVHPSALEYDNTKHNVSTITGTLLETIEKVEPSTVESPVDAIIESKATVDETTAQAFANNVSPTPSDVQSLQEQNESLYATGQTLATGSIGSEYFNLFSQADSAIAQAISQPLAAMRRVQAMITAPARFEATVKERMRVLTEQFQNMIAALPSGLNANQKRTFQASGATMMTTSAEAVVTSEYSTTNQVLQVIEIVLNNYDEYLSTIDGMQSENAASPGTYVPDLEVMAGVDQIVNQAVSDLFEIALNAQQERTIILEYDSNPIELTHRFYGLDNDDENLVRFIESNNLSLNEHLLIKKNTRILYYV